MAAEVLLEPSQVSGGFVLPHWSQPLFSPNLWCHETCHLPFSQPLGVGTLENPSSGS